MNTSEVTVLTDIEDLLKSVVLTLKYVGRRELKNIAPIFDLSESEFHLWYLHKLSLGMKLPPMVVDAELLSEAL